MKILFLCTAHNSLSQSLYLALKDSHQITIEYAISRELMLSAVSLSNPDLIICPFLTTLVPKEIYSHYLTLIIHPGPPGDAGPSSLDWVLMGDDGSIDDSEDLLRRLDDVDTSPGRTHWGVTVLQAIEEFDAGPVWAFEQFPIDIDDTTLTKSALYRGPVTRCAISATLAAISRILAAGTCSPHPHATLAYRELSVGSQEPFQGGRPHHRPLLKPARRDFSTIKHSAQQVSRRIRCSDSQPGVLSKIFGQCLFVYGGAIEDGYLPRRHTLSLSGCEIIACRNGAVCIATCDNKGVWITHIRKPRKKSDNALWPKLPATSILIALRILSTEQVSLLDTPVATGWSRCPVDTFQDIWVDLKLENNSKLTAYLHFDIYNGAMTADHCSRLINAMDYILDQSTTDHPVQALVLMGGAYFSNGIALNVIEAADDSSNESWANINRINDVVHYLLHEFPSRAVTTVAAIRGNAAAGGVALATACDFVIAGDEAVLNPAYRGIGLHGSEYHTLSYFARCGQENARHIVRAMLPMSSKDALSIGLVDLVLPGHGHALDEAVRDNVSHLLNDGTFRSGFWKRKANLSSDSLSQTRASELREMSLDFWSARSVRFHSRRHDFIRKVKPARTPLRFAEHRRNHDQDEEETNQFDNVHRFKKLAEQRTHAAIDALLREVCSEHVHYSERVRKSTIWTPPTHTETLFSCYYHPEAHYPPTPPDSPMQSDGDTTSRRSVC